MRRLAVYGALMVLLILAAWWIRTVPLDLPWHRTGLVSASLGCVLLASYALARLLQLAKLPLISGYIFFGIMAGPFVSGFMDREMVARFRLIDELALSFIAMTAGGELRLDALRERGRTIAANIVFQGVLVFAATMAVMLLAGRWFGPLAAFPPEVRISVSLLLSVVALSLSPSAVIALIGECRASGRFTDTILSVTLAMDVLIILLFTVTISGARLILSPEAAGFSAFFWLLLETLLSLVLGVGFGCLVAAYIRHIGRDVIMFLFAAAFGMSRFCAALGDMATSLWGIHLVPEPILLCMVAGFVVRNFSGAGEAFLGGLERISLPIYLLFFTMAGAALDLSALIACWPLALALCAARMLSLGVSSYGAGLVTGDPPLHRRHAWMAYVPQAGVSIGLAQLAKRELPAAGDYLVTLVLAMVTLSLMIGPITFKMAITRVGEAGGGRGR